MRGFNRQGRALLVAVMVMITAGVLGGTVFAQRLRTGLPVAAVYIMGNPEGRDVIASAVFTCLEQSGKYEVVEIDASDLMDREQMRQSKLTDAQIADWYKEAKADYVCVVQISELDRTSYVSTRMVDVRTKLAKGTAMKEVPPRVRILDFINRQVNEMLGRVESPSQPSYESAPATPPKPSVAKGTFTDGRDGRVYKTVVIGDKTWMAENLNYQTGSTDKSRCYDNDNSNCKKYGRLYEGSVAQSICPSGYRLPSRMEWNDLVRAAGKSGVPAGTALKSRNDWNDGTDAFGFSALPGGSFYGGYRNTAVGNKPSKFDDGGKNGFWWTSTKDNDHGGYYRKISSDDDVVYEGNSRFKYYFSAGSGHYHDEDGWFYSVRCVKND
jgi:uncharacterized protein (TIGR02145 family)